MVAVLVGLGGCGIGNSPKFGGNLCELGNAKSRLKLSHVPLSPAGQPSGHCGHLGRGGLYDKRRRGDFFLTGRQ